MSSSRSLLIQDLTPLPPAEQKSNVIKLISETFKDPELTFDLICPVDKFDNDKYPKSYRGLSSHAYVQFGTDDGVVRRHRMLNGMLWGNSSLKVHIILSKGHYDVHTPATYYDSEEAMRVAEEMIREENKKTKETREEEFPRLASSSSFSGSHFQNCCAPKFLTSPSPMWCVECRTGSHSTLTCSVLLFKFKSGDFKCNYCRNIKDDDVDTSHPIRYRGVLVCPKLVKKEIEEEKRLADIRSRAMNDLFAMGYFK